MIIGGLMKTSFIDWPTKICSTLFIAGCNFRCGWCHNPELVDAEMIERLEAVSENEVLTAVTERKKYIDGVCITGGEPLLSPDVVKLIRKIKDKGLEIKIDTNGSVPTLLKSLIDEGLVDYVAMDIKAPKDKYDDMTGVKVNMSLIEESIKILRQSNINYEFRTTVVKGLLDPADIVAIGKWLKGSKALYLQSFVSSEKTLDASWRGRKTYTPDEMREMCASVKDCFEKTEVRGI
jgi:pyruvate formate lyase activating enzyme